MAIFIAGTGRSGTTRLNEILGQHPDISSLSFESRFLIDPGGLQDLVDALTARYTSFHAEDALARFTRLLRDKLTGAEETSFIWWDMPGEVGPERYAEWVDGFLADLTWYSFEEVVERPGGGDPLRVQHSYGRYFADRAELIALCRDRVEGLFGAVARERGASRWCEKTPLNLLSMDFLWELFPEAAIIHIARHPFGVVASMRDQPWAPDDLGTVCDRLEPIYRRWLAYRDSRTFDNRYLELRLEDVADDWPHWRAEIFRHLGVPDFATPGSMTSGRVERADGGLSAAERSFVEQRLGFAIEGMGY